VGGVGGEAAHLAEGPLEATQHLVERLRQIVQLVAAAARGHPLGQVFGGDPTGRARHQIDRSERRPRDQGATHRGEGQPHRHRGQQDHEVAVKSVLGAGQRDADLHEPRGPHAVHHGQGQDPRALSAGQLQRLEGRPAPRGICARDRRERELAVPQRGRGPTGIALGIAELEELVDEFRPEQLAQRRLRDGAAVRVAGVADHAAHRDQ
jgi:hypothetical protein